MLVINMTGDCLRSLAMYITYAIEEAQTKAQYSRSQEKTNILSKSPARSLNPESSSGPLDGEDQQDPKLSTSQIALHLLKLYADLLCLPGETNNLMKFTKTVTNKVCPCHFVLKHGSLMSRSGFLTSSSVTRPKLQHR